MAALSPKLKLSKNPLRIHRINSEFWVSEIAEKILNNAAISD